LLLVLALVLIDGRSVKNFQLRASKRSLKTAAVLEPWCTDAAQVKAKVTGAAKCEFFTVCVKAAAPASIVDAICTRLAGLTATSGLGEAALGVRDLFLATLADALVVIIGGTDDEATKATKVAEATETVRKNNFGTAANAAAAPAEAPPAAEPPAAFVETASGSNGAAAEPAPAEAPAEAPKPENNAAPDFCSLPRAEQAQLQCTEMSDPATPTPIDQLSAKIAEICPAITEWLTTLNGEVTALEGKAVEMANKIKNFLTTSVSGWVAGAAAATDPAAAAEPAPAPAPQ